MTEPIVTVLVIDDDDVSAESVSRALKKVGGNYRIVTAVDGQDGLDALRGKSDRSVLRPYVILLDLNMPRMDGFEFLEQLRADPSLKDSVVFVLSTSDSDSDRARAYNEFIAGYMVKSSIGPQFVKLSQMLHQFSAAIKLPA